MVDQLDSTSLFPGLNPEIAYIAAALDPDWVISVRPAMAYL